MASNREESDGVSPTECLLVTKATICKQQERSDVFLERKTRSMFRKQQEEATGAIGSSSCWCIRPCSRTRRYYFECRLRRRRTNFCLPCGHRVCRSSMHQRMRGVDRVEPTDAQVRRANLRVQQQGDRPQTEDEEEEEEQTPADNIPERE